MKNPEDRAIYDVAHYILELKEQEGLGLMA